MKYGLLRNIEVYDTDTQAGAEVLATPADWMQTVLWADDNLAGDAPMLRAMRENYAWAWFALNRRGRLDEFGCPSELTLDAIEAMAGHLSVVIEEVPDDSLPLKASEPRK